MTDHRTLPPQRPLTVPEARAFILQWWANGDGTDTARSIADDFAGGMRGYLPEGMKPPTAATLRQWKKRAGGLPEPTPAEPSGTEPGPAAVWAIADTIHPWADNPRDNDPAVLTVAKSIARFGWGRALVGWQQNEARRLVVGHTAMRAYRHLLEHRPVYDFQCIDVTPGDDPVRVCPLCRVLEGGKHKPDCALTPIPGAPTGMVPIRWRDDWTEEEARAYAIADNATGEIATWADPIEVQLRELAAVGFDHALLGFDAELTLDALIAELLPLVEPDPDPEPTGDPGPTQPPAVPVSVRGEVYQLGPHRLMCGDSTVGDDVDRLMSTDLAVLWHADPPYGMGKEAEGVANDNLYREKLDAFLLSAWEAWRPHLEDNASAYMWGNAEDLWRWWWLRMQGGERMSLRNEIVWDKKTAGAGGISHMGAEGFRLYPNGSERCLFWMLGEQGFGNVNTADYWEGWEPIRSYLAGEAERMGWGPGDIKRICGVGMYSHWFSKSQWTMIPEGHYLTLQAAAEGQAFTRPYSDPRGDYKAAQLSGEHLALRQEFNEGRAYFDNTHDTMRDVWEFPRVQGDDRHDHATPKPVAMMERAVRSSAPAGGLVVEPFGGSGSTLIGCAIAGRVCFTMELLPEWCDVIRRRWTQWAEAAGVDPGPGALD